MKDELKEGIQNCRTFEKLKVLLDEQIRYYDQNRYQCKFAKLSLDELNEYWKLGSIRFLLPLSGKLKDTP